MVQIKEKKYCCGCSACSNVCPQNCISMQSDQEGFLYPQINSDECINCGCCDRVCPIENRTIYESQRKTYVGYTLEDMVRMKSSSGGIFTLVAKEILSQGGVVFGAAFDEKYEVKHIAITDQVQLEMLQGSKYTQSDLGDTFLQVKKYLREDKKVLYSGTACQIAGLKKYLGGDQPNLVTLDVLCHGVPSPKVWKKYLEEKHYGSIKMISFRHKVKDWREYNMLIQYYNLPDYDVNHNQDPFMKLFLSNASLRPSCYDCRFKEMDRPSDITLGDCWGVKKCAAEMDDGKGVSLIVIHTEKGAKLFGQISGLLRAKELPLDDVLSPHDDARCSVNAHKNRDKMFKALEKGASVEQLVEVLKPTLFQRVERKVYSWIKK